MRDQGLYDEDILLWSEQQAEIIRQLGRTRRDLPNKLDIENVAEEIESVGRSELASVKSLVRQIFLHLMKLATEPDAAAARHWRDETVAFQAELLDRYAPSMQQRLDLDQLWGSARERLMLSSEGALHHAIAALPEVSPIVLDDLLRKYIDIPSLVRRLLEIGERA